MTALNILDDQAFLTSLTVALVMAIVQMKILFLSTFDERTLLCSYQISTHTRMNTHQHGILNSNPVELETVFEPSSQYYTTVLIARKLEKIANLYNNLIL